MDASVVHFLLSPITYRELALRSREFLDYQQPQADADERQIAEASFFNLMVEYVSHAGMPRHEAEEFCDDPDNLTELAMRICSTLGPLG